MYKYMEFSYSGFSIRAVSVSRFIRNFDLKGPTAKNTKAAKIILVCWRWQKDDSKVKLNRNLAIGK